MDEGISQLIQILKPSTTVTTEPGDVLLNSVIMQQSMYLKELLYVFESFSSVKSLCLALTNSSSIYLAVHPIATLSYDNSEIIAVKPLSRVISLVILSDNSISICLATLTSC